MNTNQTIDGVLASRELLESFAAYVSDSPNAIMRARTKELRALLDAPATKNWEYFHNAMESERDYWKALAQKRAAQPQGESITIEAVAVTRDNGDGSLRLEWLLEGGIAQMEFAGMVLFAIPEANDLCDEDGSAEVYLTPPNVEQSEPVAAPLDYGSLDAVQRLAVCRGDVVPASAAPAEPNPIKGMIETIGGQYAVMIDPENGHYGWTFKKHPDGQWVSGRKATEKEMIAARSHAQITNQL